MSQPVDFVLNADVSPYTQSMGQAVAVSQQYSQVAQGVRGRVADLQTSMVGLTNRITGFNKINSVAVDTAASYQKVLSNIEGTAAVTGRSFEQLSKSTRSFAREFPIGMAGAVAVVESLQSVGVKSESQIASLGKAFIQLGAATNSNAASIGRDMTLLGKSFGNGTAQFTALSDSLTTVTKQLGASAPATIAFSKALAPIASTVGMGQTAVMGLSAAMSSLGEDGYRAANVFNKVLLDMQRTVRDGGPELKAYADLMGTTSDNLRKLFTSNPTEMLTRFTEALGKSGSESQRMLESLGFDSVRDTRSLQALSRSGGLRAAVSTAVEGYGSGSTATAAKPVMEGVLDSAEMLKETMGQTVQNIGKPLLGIMKFQLDAAQKVASIFEAVTGNEAVQKAGTVGGIAGAAAGGVNTLFQGLMLAAFGKGAVNMLRGAGNTPSARQFAQGRALATYGVGAEDPRMMSRAERAGYLGQTGLINAGLGTVGDATSTSGRMLARGAAMTGDVTNRFMRGYYGNVLRMGLGEEPWRTPTGQAYIDARKAFRAGDISRDALREARGNYLRGFGAEGVGTTGQRLLETGGAIGRDAGRFMGGTAMKAGGLLGKTFGAIGGPALAATGAIMAGSWAYSKFDEGQQNLNRLGESSGDIYSSFNNFSEATGQAGRGLVAFTAAVQQSTDVLIKSNTSMSKALTLTPEEAAAGNTPGYKTAFNVAGGSTDPKVIASQLTATLGAGAAPEDVARALTDVSSKFGAEAGRQVADIIKPYFTDNAGQDYTSLARGARSSPFAIGQWFGASAEQVAQADLAKTAAQRQAYEAGMAFPGTRTINGTTVSASGIEVVKQAEGMFNAARDAMAGKNANYGDFTSQSRAIAELFKATEEQQLASGLRSDWNATDSNVAFLNGTSFTDTVKKLAEAGNDLAKGYLAAQGAGLTKDYGWASGETDTVKYAKNLGGMFETATETGTGFTESLYAASDAATAAGKSLKELPQSALASQGQVAIALGALAKKTDAKNVYQAGSAIMEEVLKRTGGNTLAAQGQLQTALTNAPSTQPEMIAGLQSAIEQLGRGPGAMQMAQWGPGRTLNEQIRQGWDAQQIQQFAPSQMTAATQMTINTGQAAESAQMGNAQAKLMAFGQLQAGIAQASRSAGIQMAAIARDGRLKEQWATEDYNKQKRRATQDFHTQERYMEQDKARQLRRMRVEHERGERYGREDYDKSVFRATRDFQKSMVRAERDYNIQRDRVVRDFDIGISRAKRDFAKQETRATEDYNKARARAEEDYQKSVFRANRDFNIQQSQALEDYNRSRMRALQDYNKMVKRMVEDSAKQMYDPYKRIAAQMVMDAGQLITNLKDQTAAIDKQVGNLASARAMGLSEEAIKALNLADASNAQQLQRLVEDSQGNPSFIGQLNTQVSAKNTAASTLVQDQGNTTFARAQEDFATQMARGEEDFTISAQRAREAFTRSMEDGAVDYNTAMSRMAEDFTLTMSRSRADFDTQLKDQYADLAKTLGDMSADYLKMVTDARADFNTSMGDMLLDYETSVKRADEVYAQSVDYVEQDHARALKRMTIAFHLQMKRAHEDFDVAIERMRIQTANAISDVGAQLGASIASMKESFASWMETAGMGVEETAQAIVDMYNKLGIPKDQLGQADKAMLEWANMVLKHAKTAGDALDVTMGKFYAFGGMPASNANDQSTDFSSPSADTVSSQSMVPPKMPKLDWSLLTTDVNDYDWSTIGANIWQGILEGLQTAFTGEGSIGAWVMNIVNTVKGWLGIKSPSTVFMEIGVSVVEGLSQGIQSMATTAWEFLTAPIANLDIMGKVTSAWEATSSWMADLGSTISGLIGEGWANLTAPIANLDIMGKITTAWTTAGDWLGDLGTTVSGLITGAWDKLTAPLKDLDIKTAVTTAFSAASTWLGGLVGDGADSIKGWVSTAWDNLTANLPTIEDIKSAVVDIFTGKNGLSSWLGNLPTTIKDDWLPKADFFTEAFSSIVQGIKNTLGAMIESWNQIVWKLDFTLPKIDIPGFSVKGFSIPMPGGKSIDFGGFDWGGTTIGGQRFETGDIVPNIPNPWAPKALGGISMRPEYALLAEAGYPEAVIPLNERGASYMADVLSRYMGNADAKQAMVSPYATSVTVTQNYNYDQSTKITGPITVEAQDPDAMAAALEAKQRRQRLANPIGGQR